MGVRVTDYYNQAALYDSVSGVAFGPVFQTFEDAEAFLEFLRDIGERDPRVISAAELAKLRQEWDEERDDG